MNYEQFLEQMKEDLQARFAEDLPPELADVRIGIRDVEKLQGESYRILPRAFFPQRGLPGRGQSQHDRCLSGV